MKHRTPGFMDAWTTQDVAALLAHLEHVILFLDRFHLFIVVIYGWMIINIGRSLYDAFMATAGTLNSDR